jgi:dTDP-4-dehydrorhamnose 3,5-epimerase
MKFIETEFEGLLLVKFDPFEDQRGVFIKPWISQSFEEYFGGVSEVYFSTSKSGTLRGLHYQIGSAAQKKYIVCLKGSVEDIALDMRLDSDTYGKVFRHRLDEMSGVGVLVPEGFAHGIFAHDESIVVNFCNKPYSPGRERGVGFKSLIELSDLKIKIVSKKDSEFKPFTRSFVRQ